MKIMIVDDSQTMRMIVMRTIRAAGYTGHSFVEAGNGKDAIKSLQGEKPDLVLMDWNMPEMNGITCLKTIQAFGYKTPVVFVTSESTQDARNQATDAGAAGLITKPFTVESFRDTLGQFLA